MSNGLRYARITFSAAVLTLSGMIIPAHGQGASSGVSAVGNLSSRSITDKELLGFTITITNRSASEVTSVRLAGLPDSYQLVSVCANSQNRGIRCYTGEQFSADSSLLWNTVPPNQTITAWGHLRPTVAHDTATLTVVLAWNSASTSSWESSLAVKLGENRVEDEAKLARTLAVEILKIFAIPATLAVLAFFLNRIATNRDNRRIEAEREKESTRQKLQREESLRAETWKLMLPISHEYAVKHYLPLTGALQRLLDALQGGQKHLAFFYLLFTAKRAQIAHRAIGGLYFKDIVGETLVAECWKRQAQILQGEVDQPLNLAIKACVNQLKPDETYDGFASKLEKKLDGTLAFTDDIIQHAWLLFQTELFSDQPRLKSGILHLQALYAILVYESNRPYEHWYPRPVTLSISEEVQNLLREIAKQTVVIKITEEDVEAYLKSARTA
jgi:hypothetical protein